MNLKQLATMSALMLIGGQPALGALITPDVIFGSGNDNGSFTVTTFDSGGIIELGLRAKLRYNDAGNPENTFNWDGVNTYTFAPTAGTPANRSVFNYEWSINTQDRGASIESLIGSGAYARIEYDIDPSALTSFVSYNPFDFDAYYGTNATGNGGGTYDNTGTPVSGATVAQNSVNYGFLPGAPLGQGIYDVRLTAFNSSDQQLGSTAIRINSVPEPSILALMGLGLAGLSFARYRKQQA
jgi:hypothetical protein